MLRSAAVFALVLGCSLLQAADLNVRPAPGMSLGYIEAAEPGKWVALKGDGSLEFVPLTVVNGGSAAYLEAKPGRYGVLYFPPGDTAQPITTIVVLGGAEPDPPPPPPPPPIPDLAKLWVLIVRESGSQDQATNHITTSAQVRQLVTERGYKLRVVDPDERGPDGEIPSDIAPYLAAIGRDGRAAPHLFITDDQAKLLFDGPLPDSVNSMLQLLRSVGGGR